MSEESISIGRTTGQIYLTRRNLLTLLSKLDRKKQGEKTQCTIIKYGGHPEYPQIPDCISVVAVEDTDYYTRREPGEVYPDDDPARKA